MQAIYLNKQSLGLWDNSLPMNLSFLQIICLSEPSTRILLCYTSDVWTQVIDISIYIKDSAMLVLGIL